MTEVEENRRGLRRRRQNHVIRIKDHCSHISREKSTREFWHCFQILFHILIYESCCMNYPRLWRLMVNRMRRLSGVNTEGRERESLWVKASAKVRGPLAEVFPRSDATFRQQFSQFCGDCTAGVTLQLGTLSEIPGLRPESRERTSPSSAARPTKRVVCIRGAAERVVAGHSPPINEGEARAASPFRISKKYSSKTPSLSRQSND
ncbi:hypothetical protein EAG_16224 [Camponotus floridanus]|uniref:Uncharacterized protein n=1 Tax=Camponotus floridanus TaxID=104421 RepID=E2AG52_CAMFO|nr:hypothetical protein EAG_16224 [Camponotus floridanus]